MKQKLTRKGIGFAQIKNEVLADDNLSWKAKGLFAYLYSKPDDWDFAISRIAKESNEGEWSVRTGLQELESRGYLIRTKLKTGRVEYFISYEPDVENQQKGQKPDVENRSMQKPHSAKINTISNKDNILINNTSNTSSNEVAGLNEFIELFEPVNPSYKTLYPNKTQRACLTRMIKEHGEENLRAMIEILPKINEIKYMPITTTPYELEKNMGKIKGRIKQQESSIAIIQ